MPEKLNLARTNNLHVSHNILPVLSRLFDRFSSLPATCRASHRNTPTESEFQCYISSLDEAVKFQGLESKLCLPILPTLLSHRKRFPSEKARTSLGVLHSPLTMTLAILLTAVRLPVKSNSHELLNFTNDPTSDHSAGFLVLRPQNFAFALLIHFVLSVTWTSIISVTNGHHWRLTLT